MQAKVKHSWVKQSPRCWNSTFDGHLKELGFKQTVSDSYIYYMKTGEGIIAYRVTYSI